MILMILQPRLKTSECYRKQWGDAFQILAKSDFQLGMYKYSYIITRVREDFIGSTRSQKLFPLYPFLRKRLHLPKWESKLRKKKTKDPENRLMQERNEGNSQDYDKSKFKHDCYLFSGPKVQSVLIRRRQETKRHRVGRC